MIIIPHLTHAFATVVLASAIITLQQRLTRLEKRTKDAATAALDRRIAALEETE